MHRAQSLRKSVHPDPQTATLPFPMASTTAVTAQPCTALQTLDLSSLAQYFHLRINDVARRLGVCATVLKKICRKHGIPRWPQRKLASIDRRISLLKKPRRRLGTKEAKRIQLEVDFLLGQRDLLMKDPAAVMGSSAHEDSKCPFEQELIFSDGDEDEDLDDDSDDVLDNQRDSPSKKEPRHANPNENIDVIFPVAKNENIHPSLITASKDAQHGAPFYRFKETLTPRTASLLSSSNSHSSGGANRPADGRSTTLLKNLSCDSLASLHSNVSSSGASAIFYATEARHSPTSALDALVSVAAMAPVDIRLPELMFGPHPALPPHRISSAHNDDESDESDDGDDDSGARFASILRRCGARVFRPAEAVATASD